MGDMKSEIIDIMTENYGVDRKDILAGKSFNDLGLDSIALVEIQADVESKYNVEVTADDILGENNIDTFISRIEKKGVKL